MMNLLRIEQNSRYTRGLIRVNGAPICATVELPWRDNNRNVSCIPEGSYSIAKHKSLKYGNCLKILNVPNRTGILMHVANYAHELEGCIAPGLSYNVGGTDPGVAQSRIALDRLLDIMPGQDTLVIERFI